MAIEKLTHAAVSNAKPDSKDYILGDGNGLFLLVRSSGHKGWIFVYSLHGKRHKYTLGPFSAYSLADARLKAAVARKLVADGIHPIDDDNRRAAEARAHAAALKAGTVPQTVGDLFRKWDESYLSVNHSDKGEYVRRLYTNHVAPTLDDLLLAELRPRHILAVLDKAHASGLTRTCGVILSNLRQMFVYGLPREWVAGDPTAGMKSATWDGDAKEVERHLTEEELIEFVGVLQRSKLPRRWKRAIKLILAVGTRVGETLNAPLKNITFGEDPVWFIPPELQKQTKGKAPPQPLWINLSPFAVKQIQAIMQLNADEAKRLAKRENREYVAPVYLFPNGDGTNHVDLKTLTKAVRIRQLEEQLAGKTPDFDDLKLSGGHWTPHDIRRTFATLAGELNIPPDVIDKCINHVEEQKIKRIYQRQKLRPAMKQAWLEVGEKLETIFKDDDPVGGTAVEEEEEDI